MAIRRCGPATHRFCFPSSATRTTTASASTAWTIRSPAMAWRALPASSSSRRTPRAVAGGCAHEIRFEAAEPAAVRRLDNGLLSDVEYASPVAGNRLMLRDELFVDDALVFDRLTSRRVVYGAPNGPA